MQLRHAEILQHPPYGPFDGSIYAVVASYDDDGLQLISFRAHTLTDQQLLAYCADLLNDCRDPLVISTIRVLQRRDGEAISECLAELCRSNSLVIAEAAFRALGCIATPVSQRLLQELSASPEDPTRQELAHRQLNQQFRS